MQRLNRPQVKWRNAVLVGIGLFVILADQLSKAWIRANLDTGQSLFDAGFLQLVHIHNTGAAFGIFQNHTLTLTIVNSVGVVIILLLVFVLQGRWSFLDSLLVRSGIGLVLGGTIGNLIDRFRLGYVSDFIDFKVWPAFNIADAAVTVGVIIIAYRILYLAQPAKHR
jgi:signal peptidase II